MSTDSRIDADLKALADATARGLPTIDDTAGALAEARARSPRGGFMKTLRKPIYATAGGLAVVAAVLIFPVPYTHVNGYDLSVAASGKVALVHVPARDRARAERRAAALRRDGATVTITPRSERVWGSVYAMAKEKLRIAVDLDGRSDDEIAADIRGQLARAGWSPGEIAVERGADGAQVKIGAADRDGNQLHIWRKVRGDEDKHMEIEMAPPDIDTAREPGMSDAQLRDKIVKQLRARGLEAEVEVDGDRVMIRGHHVGAPE